MTALQYYLVFGNLIQLLLYSAFDHHNVYEKKSWRQHCNLGSGTTAAHATSSMLGEGLDSSLISTCRIYVKVPRHYSERSC